MSDEKRSADGWLWWPSVGAAGFWSIMIAPLILVGNPWAVVLLLHDLVILPIALLIWLVITVTAIFFRQWRLVASNMAAALVLAGLTVFLIRFSDEIHFWTLSPYYFNRVINLSPNDRSGKEIRFYWYGDTSLYYDEREVNGPGPGRTVRSWVTDQDCTLEAKRMFGHFYVLRGHCPE